jgi:urocanate hydratase
VGQSARDKYIARGLWNDPGSDVMRRADAGYEIAKECAQKWN